MEILEVQRKIINHGVHDLTNARYGVSIGIRNMLRKLEKNELTLEELPERFERILKCCERIDEAADYIYEESKKLRENGSS